MTDLRTAAQQALEALEGGADSWQLVGPAIDALRTALVEDAMQKFTDVNQELEAALGCDHCNQPLYAAVKCRVCGRVTSAEPVQEPVAGRAFLERILAAMEGVIDVADRKTDEFDALRSCVIDLTLMLHTAPPQRPAEPVQEPQCNPHPKAPHGFLRNASHTEDRYVCECEYWDPYEAGYQAGMEAALKEQA